MLDIVCIGSTTRDNFLELDYKLINWPKTPLKKAIVLPLGEKLGVKRVVFTIGGNAANGSVTFARQGFKAGCFAKVGNDLAGKAVENQLRKERVVSKLAVSKNKPTAFSVLLLKDGERTILGYHGASDTLVGKDVPWNFLKSKWWYLSLAGESDKLLKPLLAFAKKNNIKIAFNPSGHNIEHRKKDILSILKYVDFLVLNEGEAASLLNISFNDEKAVFKKLDKLVPGIVAVTDGPRGVTVSDGLYIYKAGVFKEKKVMDRTGAGDAFGSGFVAGLMRREMGKPKNKNGFTVDDLQYAIRLATANATSVVEKIGATEGILAKNDFLSSRWKNLKIKTKKI